MHYYRAILKGVRLVAFLYLFDKLSKVTYGDVNRSWPRVTHHVPKLLWNRVFVREKAENIYFEEICYSKPPFWLFVLPSSIHTLDYKSTASTIMYPKPVMVSGSWSKWFRRKRLATEQKLLTELWQRQIAFCFRKRPFISFTVVISMIIRINHILHIWNGES